MTSAARPTIKKKIVLKNSHNTNSRKEKFIDKLKAVRQKIKSNDSFLKVLAGSSDQKILKDVHARNNKISQPREPLILKFNGVLKKRLTMPHTPSEKLAMRAQKFPWVIIVVYSTIVVLKPISPF